MNKEEFKQMVLTCGNTGSSVKLPNNLDRVTCGNVMAEVAAFFLDTGQDIKAIIILNQRQILGI